MSRIWGFHTSRNFKRGLFNYIISQAVTNILEKLDASITVSCNVIGGHKHSGGTSCLYIQTEVSSQQQITPYITSHLTDYKVS